MKYLYSGKCRLGTCGTPTKFTDLLGKRLFVGDIVVLMNIPDVYTTGLTAVVSDEFTSYSDGTHVVKPGPVEPFVMGIKSVDLTTTSEWSVLKVKDHSDVIHGEHWREYGFHYEEEQP